MGKSTLLSKLIVDIIEACDKNDRKEGEFANANFTLGWIKGRIQYYKLKAVIR